MSCNVSPREAHAVDPQQPLLATTARQALYDAGIAPAAVRGQRCGVFVGISSFDYALLLAQGDPSSLHVDGATGLGTALSLAANRLSYGLGVEGPSMAIDTACSGSLYALHLAVQSLRRNECDAALVAGVNVILSPVGMIFFSKLGAMAADGRCKTFDARADGYVRSEACAAVYLQPLPAALAAGSRIYAVVRGSAINHDGCKSGLIVPRRSGQAKVITAAWHDAPTCPHRSGVR